MAVTVAGVLMAPARGSVPSRVRRACIDIGSNTTRLLVADSLPAGGLSECHQERALTRLGACLDADGVIPATKCEEVVVVVAGQLARARELGAVELVCVATAGLRRAANGRALVARVAEACHGLEVRVLSEEEEARFTFIGAVSASSESAGHRVAVVDVGGGSTEVVSGTGPDAVEWWASVALGSSDAAALGLACDPPTAAQIDGARARLRERFERLAPPPVELALAVGGSAGTLHAIAGDRLDARALARALELVTAAGSVQVAADTGLEPARVAMLPAGLLILEAAATRLGMALTVSGAGLREGLLLALDTS